MLLFVVVCGKSGGTAGVLAGWTIQNPDWVHCCL